MKKKIIIILFIMFIFKTNALALKYGGCEYSDVSRMKRLVNNINVTYNYRIVNNIAYFDVTLTNITDEMYIVDNITYNVYYNNGTGEITIPNFTSKSVTFSIYSNRSDCRSLFLGSKYAQFPIYNKYHTSDMCKNISDFSYCKKWVPKAYTEAEIKKAIDDYYNKPVPEDEPIKYIEKKTLLDKLIEIYVKYYIIILASIILVCLALIEIIRKKKRFKL